MRVASAGPVTTLRTADGAVVLDDIDEAAGRAELDRGVGNQTAPVIVSTSSRTLTNWLGNSALSGLAKVARSLNVPVVVST